MSASATPPPPLRGNPATAMSTTYILVTGANSGLGFSICTRLIDEFLPTRPSTARLHLIPTTRSRAKADSTVSLLRQHLDTSLCKTHGADTEEFRQELGRVVVEPELLDLCSLVSVYRAARRLRRKYPRLDTVVLNAGIGGWDGVDWWGVVQQLVRDGPLELVTRPTFKMAVAGKCVQRQINAVRNAGVGEEEEEEPKLGEVFCANVFGHYVLAHELMPLLTRRKDESREKGRVIWVSTLEAYARTFDVDDLQAIRNKLPYESSKRLTDLLVLTAGLPSASPYTETYFSTSTTSVSALPAPAPGELTPRKASLRSSTRSQQRPNGTLSRTPSSSRSRTRQQQTQRDQGERPKMYLSHPGICVTGIMPLHWIMVYGWIIALYIARFFGSPWHTTSSYPGATSMTWLALASEETLETLEAEDAEEGAAAKGSSGVKWGSAVNWVGSERVKKSEVERWVDEKGVPASERERMGFEEVGRECWRQMEGLRVEWEARVRNVVGADEDDEDDGSQ